MFLSRATIAMRTWVVFGVLGAIVFAGVAQAAESYVETTASSGSFPIVSQDAVATIFVDADRDAGVWRVANDLKTDIQRVTGKEATVTSDVTQLGDRAIIVGTVGKSAVLKQLQDAGKIDVTDIQGKWESFFLQVVDNPLPNLRQALVIAGSDKRGTIFGVYDLSQQMGVSPWHWWADVPTRHKANVFVKAGRTMQGEPAVKYRGLFINDEAPALTGLIQAKFGGKFNSDFYEKVFELTLRLKGNYHWPSMWEPRMFYVDDPQNGPLAEEMGIVIGTTHHEPLLRAHHEWDVFGQGRWNYATNAEALQKYWRESLESRKQYETILTIGMRGDGDAAMAPGGPEANKALLEDIVDFQRKLIAEVVNPDVTKVPQLWALYKEVQGYYDAGMRVPDDVTLLWCDDNWGNIRRLPTTEEQARSGGAGVYYHFDYVGGPRNYKWLNTNPLPKIWEQMNLALDYKADKIWIVNVGDIKPMEFPISFFMKLAWEGKAIGKDGIAAFTRDWAEQQFGPEYADEIAVLLAKYGKLAGRRKPELIEPRTFSLVNYNEAERVLAEYDEIIRRAEEIQKQLPANARDAFFELVLHQPKAMKILTELYITSAKNRLYVDQGRAAAPEVGRQVAELFAADKALTDYFNNELAGGKWTSMMAQTHIGYRSWQEPRQNTMPYSQTDPIAREEAGLGVAIEGSSDGWPASMSEAKLPQFDIFNRQTRWIEVFNTGKTPFEFTATANEPWIKLSQTSGRIEQQSRILVNIDWSKAPVGVGEGAISISGAGSQDVKVNLETFKPSDVSPETLQGFIETEGYVSIEAEHYTNKVDRPTARWELIPDYGRTLSGMSPFPSTAKSFEDPTQGAPRLEYQLYATTPGDVRVESIIGPSLAFQPGRGVRLAVSFDDEAPKIVDVMGAGTNRDGLPRNWEASVRDSKQSLFTTHTISSPGYHTLKVWMVDPAIVLQKIVVDMGGVKPSYLGPPESYRGQPAVALRSESGGQ